MRIFFFEDMQYTPVFRRGKNTWKKNKKSSLFYKIYAMRLSNMAMAVDMIDEEGKFEFFYAKEAMEHRYAAAFKVGVNVAFPDEIVRFQLTA